MKTNLSNFPKPKINMTHTLQQRICDYLENMNNILIWLRDFTKLFKAEIKFLKSLEPNDLYDYIHEDKFEREILGK